MFSHSNKGEKKEQLDGLSKATLIEAVNNN